MNFVSLQHVGYETQKLLKGKLKDMRLVPLIACSIRLPGFESQNKRQTDGDGQRQR